ncbi:MAG TPA: nucleotide exchange factor GrpE [Bacteroidales bacterium]|mgnify:CR=1 FL=1|nr:nucleotide exchange factor GrpE [Bacteroidales bacterium]
MSKHKKNTAKNHEPEMAEHAAEAQPTTNAEEQAMAQEQQEQDAVSSQLDTLQNNFNELNDKYLRLFSEFDNYRKRTLKEKIELSKTASADLIKVLLPVVDDFERAINTFPETDHNGHYEGIKLIYNNLKRILEQQGLEEIKALGEPFDTDYHEAVTHIPAPDEQQKGKVLEVIKKGYSLQGKIIRFAQVIVGS